MDTNIKATIIACLFTLCMSVAGAYGILKIDGVSLKKDVVQIERVTAAQDRRIIINHENITRIKSKMIKLETLLPQILSGIGDIKSDVGIIKGEVGNLRVTVGILNDREEIRSPHNGT